ncbi:MAG: SpoIID/LytB domain-containing protein [Candidatus Cloacimonetes bacterium]|nr:SpoIID/LytB domain-containing protein [Candidatus Cloacimonadota bacterium]MDD3283272.1 SpoIID/LytB domain-containing protein [Candidatus Cloacimonadota bacterium]MDY0298739.1 SpoIID/LytB domain-containing protein [Candidatus Cloacimonadaceae bacterium]
MRKILILLSISINMLFGAEIRDGTLFLEINLASAAELRIEGSSFFLTENNELFKQDCSGEVTCKVVSQSTENQFGIISRIDSCSGYDESEAIINSHFIWKNGQLALKHEYWFFLPHSFQDLAQAQAYATAIDYPFSSIQSIPVVNSTLQIIQQDGEISFFESPLKIYSDEGLWINGLPYEGEFILKVRNGKLVLNHLLPIEEYIAGVIPNEIGNYSPLEALKAQAVAARSHAISLLLNNRHSKDGYDLCNTTHCQVYKGKHLRNELIEEAVMQSAGEIMVINGKVADATYHSCCGGKTDSSQAIWNGAYIEHLSGSICIAEAESYSLETEKGVTSWLNRKVDTTGMSSWEKKTLNWNRSISKADVANKLGLKYIRSFEVLERGISGRVTKLRIVGDHNVTLDSEYKIRQTFGMLPSSLFVFIGSSGKSVFQPAKTINIQGRGSGHGVGMCQVGALRKARNGSDYLSILQAYYPNTEISTQWIDNEGP